MPKPDEDNTKKKITGQEYNNTLKGSYIMVK